MISRFKKTATKIILILLLNSTHLSYGQMITFPNFKRYPSPSSLTFTENSSIGTLIPRSMYLLHSGQKIKIAIYGQSLSSPDNAWWTTLGNALKTAYPNAEIDIRSFGVGGVLSILLCRLTNQELVAFHPDLVIFHVYGNHYFYETIIRQIKGCTTAEILVQGDRFSKTDGTENGGEWNYDLSDMTKWDNNMSFQIVKDYCDNYKLERNNRRNEWYDYLRANNYSPDKLLKDKIHFNEQGQWLVAALTARHFVYNANRDIDPEGMVTYYEVGKGIAIEDGKISLSFDGNKVELIPTGKTTSLVSATIDTKKPSEFTNTYYYTIPTGGFWGGAPFLRPGMGMQQEEDWTIIMTGNGNFTVSGSKTGFDGTGNINNVFISNSKRIILNKKNDWGNYGAPKTSGAYTFKSITMSVDKIDFDTINYDSQKENGCNQKVRKIINVFLS